MEKNRIALDNSLFFLSVVGMVMGIWDFAQTILESFMEQSQFPTDNFGEPGYIRIDSSAIWERGEDCWREFAAEINEKRLLHKVSYGFSSATKFEGELNERAVLKKDRYVFIFEIKEYERDAEHEWKIIRPEALGDIPENEKLGRVVYLTIALEE